MNILDPSDNYIENRNLNPGLIINEDFPFALTAYGHFYSDKTYAYIRTSGQRDDYLLFYTVAGEGILEQNGDVQRLLPQSSCVIDSSKAQIYYTSPDVKLWEFIYIHFKAKTVEPYADSLMSSLRTIYISDAADFRKTLDELFVSAEENRFSAYAKRSDCISHLLTAMIADEENRTAGNETHLTNEKVKALVSYINDNMAQPLTLDDFCKVLMITKFHLSRIFRENVGMSPMKYLNQCRIHQACLLLQTEDLPVSEIAEKVGFSSSTVFERHFLEITGVSPTKYRRLLRNA